MAYNVMVGQLNYPPVRRLVTGFGRCNPGRVGVILYFLGSESGRVDVEVVALVGICLAITYIKPALGGEPGVSRSVMPKSYSPWVSATDLKWCSQGPKGTSPS